MQMYQMSNSELLLYKVISVMFMFGMGRPTMGNVYRITGVSMQHLHPRYKPVLREHKWRVSGFVCDGIWRIDVGRRPLWGATRALH
jgi:hypothetical protein